MKKRLSDFIRKLVFILIGSALWSFAGAQVTLTTVVEPGSYGTPEITSTGDACLDYTGITGNDQSFAFEGVTLSNATYIWSVAGGVQIVNSSGTDVTVRPFTDSLGRYNKGRVTVRYNGTIDSTVSASCGGTSNIVIQVPKSGVAYVDLYQKFDYPNQIIGPVCVSEGDFAVYSIKGLVSGNIEDGIGIDTYYWNLDSISGLIEGSIESYISGDRSSVTVEFAANPTGNGNEQIKVIAGQCNASQEPKVITLAPQLPHAEVTGAEACIPSSTTQVALTNTVRTGVSYKWLLGNNNFTFVAGSDENSQEGISVNIGIYSGNIYIISTADSSGNYCSAGGVVMDTIRIKRSLDNSISISGPTCVTPGTYNYTLSPDPSMSVNWILPPGWSMDNPANEHSSDVDIIVGNTISETINVVSQNCPNDTIALVVNGKPGNPGSVSGDSCLVRGSSNEQEFSISEVNPSAQSYSWTYPAGWEVQGSGSSNLITLNPDGETSGIVTVRALGMNGCNSDELSSINVNYTSIQPGTITVTSTGACNNSGKKDTVSFSVTPVVGQYFHWLDIPGWTVISANSDSSTITYQTDGIPGIYKAKVQGISDAGCGVSLFDSANTSIAEYNYEIVYQGDDDFYWVRNLTINNDNATSPCEACTYKWYLVIDGVVYPAGGDPLEIYQIPFRPYRALLNGYGDIEDSTDYTIVVDIIESGGCTTRRIYGASLNENTPPSNFRMAANSLEGITEETNLFSASGSNELSIKIPKGFLDGELTIVNSELQKVYKADDIRSEIKISTASFEEGVYYIHIRKNGKFIKKKVIILK